jgi:hypothetical protein
LALASSGVWSVTVDPLNQFFRVSGDFVVDSRETSLVRHLGTESEVTISKNIEEISADCFKECRFLSSVCFEDGCRVARFGEGAFSGVLQSICVRSSLESIGEQCCHASGELSSVTFESGSRLSILG